MREHILSISNLVARYGRSEVLHEVSLSVRRGGVSVLLGANGAGKTTLLRAISGVITRSGTIEFEGDRIDAEPPTAIARKRIAHCTQGRGTFTDLTVCENLLVGAYVRRDRVGISKSLTQIYELFPRLRDRADRKAGTLSGGEQQMLAIGRALMMEPKLLLLDEPSLGLAPSIVEEVYGTLSHIVELHQFSMLIVEQHAQLALELADDAYVLEAGRISATGSPQELMENDSIRQAYLG